MTNVYRECFTCGKSFLYTEMESLFYPDWHKIIYHCKDCSIREGAGEDRFCHAQSPDSNYELNTFAEKYKSLKGKIEWGDK